jgi:hypothetical protein
MAALYATHRVRMVKFMKSMAILSRFISEIQMVGIYVSLSLVYLNKNNPRNQNWLSQLPRSAAAILRAADIPLWRAACTVP